MKDEHQEQKQRNVILGLLDADGMNSVVMHLFPKAIARVMQAVEWAKEHPDVEHVEVVLHGEKPDALTITMSRSVLLGITAEIVRQQQGIVLQ